MKNDHNQSLTSRISLSLTLGLSPQISLPFATPLSTSEDVRANLKGSKADLGSILKGLREPWALYSQLVISHLSLRGEPYLFPSYSRLIRASNEYVPQLGSIRLAPLSTIPNDSNFSGYLTPWLSFDHDSEHGCYYYPLPF